MTTSRPIPIDRIIAEVCAQFGVDFGDIRGRQRNVHIVRARRVLVGVVHRLHYPRMSYPEITRAVYGDERAHSTVMEQLAIFSRTAAEEFFWGEDRTSLGKIAAAIEARVSEAKGGEAA